MAIPEEGRAMIAVMSQSFERLKNYFLFSDSTVRQPLSLYEYLKNPILCLYHAFIYSSIHPFIHSLIHQKYTTHLVLGLSQGPHHQVMGLILKKLIFVEMKKSQKYPRSTFAVINIYQCIMPHSARVNTY